MLFKASGVGFAGSVGEHNEGFAMWNIRANPYNVAARKPKRGVAGELAKAIRGQGMKFMTAMYHAEAWYFYLHWKRATLPTPFTASRTTPVGTSRKMKSTRIPVLPITESFSQAWIDRARRFRTAGRKNSRKSRINTARSDMDRFRVEIHSRGLQARLSGLLLQRNRDLCATYKWHNMVVGSGIEDPEQGKRGDLTHNFRVADISKNSVLILNVSPKADGTIPEKAQHILLGMGCWLSVNDEAICGTTPWNIAGKGPAGTRGRFL